MQISSRTYKLRTRDFGFGVRGGGGPGVVGAGVAAPGASAGVGGEVTEIDPPSTSSPKSSRASLRIWDFFELDMSSACLYDKFSYDSFVRGRGGASEGGAVNAFPRMPASAVRGFLLVTSVYRPRSGCA